VAADPVPGEALPRRCLTGPAPDQESQIYRPDSPEEIESITPQLIVVGRNIGALLKAFTPPMNDVALFGAMLYDVDLSGLDLSRANLTGSGVQTPW
jgi:hypothetical protein